MLSGEDLRRFGKDGYLVLPQVVPENLLSALDAEIDALIAGDPPPTGTVGKHFWFLPQSHLPAADAALRRSGALDVARELVAPHALDHGLDHMGMSTRTGPIVLTRIGPTKKSAQRPPDAISGYTAGGATDRFQLS